MTEPQDPKKLTSSLAQSGSGRFPPASPSGRFPPPTPNPASPSGRFPAATPPPPGSASARFAAATPAPGDDRASARASVERVLRSDPLFSPLPELALQRERVLGQGGMGVVELVLDRRLGRRAALKLLRTEAGNSVARFRREALITARLDHPNIPPVYEAGRTSAGQHFLLMRFVDGKSLAEICEQEPAPEGAALRERLSVLAKICEAVAYAHSKRVVHRDLKPANVMVGSFGEVLVMDWGLAKNLDEKDDLDAAERIVTAHDPTDEEAKPGLTRAGALLGTPGYMAPEQVKGEALDERADVFALGAILVELLTGKGPFDGESVPAILTATVDGQATPLRERRPDLPPELGAIAAHALEPRARDRYPGALELAADLHAFLEGRPVSVYAERPLEQAVRLVRGHPALFASGFVAVLASAVAALFLGLKNAEISRQNRELVTKTDELAQKSEEISRKNEALVSRGKEVARKNDELVAKSVELEKTIESLEAEKKEREAAEQKRAVAEKDREAAEGKRLEAERTTDLLATARSRLAAGAPADEVQKLVEDAIRARPTEAVILDAARILARAGRLDDARLALRQCADRFPPAYPALFALHELDAAEGGFRVSAPLRELASRAEARHEQNEFTALVACADAYQKHRYADARAAADGAIERAPRLAIAFAFRAAVKAETGDFTSALEDTKVGIQLDPEVALIWGADGHARLAGGDFDSALRSFDRAIAIAPQNAELLARRAGVRATRSDLAGADKDSEAALRLGPDLPIAHAIAAAVRLSHLDFEGALAQASRAIELDPGYPAAYLARGMARQTRLDLAGALADLDKAIELGIGVAQAWAGRAQIKLLEGDLDGARKDCELALAKDARSKDALSIRAQVRLYSGDLDGALLDANQGVSIDASYLSTRFTRAIVKETRGEHDAAYADATRALELAPNVTGIRLVRVEALLGKGDADGALAEAELFLKANPADADALACRALVQLRRGDTARALADAEAALAKVPGSAYGTYARGVVHAKRGELDAATADLDKAVELMEKTLQLLPATPAGALAHRAVLRVKRGNVAGALADAERSLQKSPREGLAVAARGLARGAQKQHDLALADLDRATELSPALPEPWRWRGEARLARGDKKGAAQDYERFLAVSRDEKDRAEIRAKLAKLPRD